MTDHSNRRRRSQNPFSLSFGRKPAQYIVRLFQTEEIIDDFWQEVPSSQVYMITGVRGSGKTVFMSAIAREFEESDEWIVIELNPERDPLAALVSALYAQPGMAEHFVEAGIDLSFFGIGISLRNHAPVTDYDTALMRMMKEVQKQRKRVLVTIDEVSNTSQIRTFVASFQILLRKNLPIQLLMTGLYENIYELQNEKTLTFLYRAPKVQMEPLNFSAMQASYENALGISYEKAGQMAALVRGYPYAFQLLGYLFWKQRPDRLTELLPLFDQYLEEYVYAKIWSELSPKDREVLAALSVDDSMRVGELRERVGMNSSSFSTYRARLLRKGVVSANEWGMLTMTLPRFSEFVKGTIAEERLKKLSV